MRNMLWADGGRDEVGRVSLARVLSSSGGVGLSFQFVRWSFRFVRWVLGEFKQRATLIGLCGRGSVQNRHATRSPCNRRSQRLRRFCSRSRRRAISRPSPAPDDPSHPLSCPNTDTQAATAPQRPCSPAAPLHGYNAAGSRRLVCSSHQTVPARATATRASSSGLGGNTQRQA